MSGLASSTGRYGAKPHRVLGMRPPLAVTVIAIVCVVIAAVTAGAVVGTHKHHDAAVDVQDNSNSSAPEPTPPPTAPGSPPGPNSDSPPVDPTNTTAPANSKLAPLLFNRLPLGAVQPAGWLLDQLNVQANGLAGHEHDFYNYVANSTWTGGTATYSNLNEGGSYWFNGMVANAFVLNDTRLKGQVQSFLDYVLAHQAEDGWLGPEPRILWGRYPALLGLMQFAEADPSQADKIVTAMHKFVALANKMLHNNGDGVDEWGAARYADFILVLQWLYDNHPNDQQPILLDTMQLLKQTGMNWTDVFSPSKFPTGDTGKDGRIEWHGVNIGQALKARAVEHRFTQDAGDAEATSQWWDIVYKYHGRPSGVFAADEHLAGMAANRGTELCQVVEQMYSGSYVWQAFGDNGIADLVERMAYNALPATLTADMWAHQYLQQLNQIWAKHLDPNVFATDGADANVFGLEPNYPCCTVNHPQGFPKFVSNSFATTADNRGLVQVYLGPFSAKTTLSGGNAVSVTVDTQYPFSDTLSMTITAQKAYTHYVRIPDWATANGKALVTLNGGAAAPVKVGDHSLLAIPAKAGETKVTLNLPDDIRTESGPTGGVHVLRGPLLWSSDLFHTTNVLRQNALEPHAQDLEFVVNVGWQFAIDPATLAFLPNTLNGSLPTPIFRAETPPVRISAQGCPVNWTTTSGSADDPPSNPTCTGDEFQFIFWPYGSTKLRLAELPTFKSTVA
ncbi:hypothetical protein EXIGLDRAFT_740764 [Exidia glandulosa HHB12029]|uniref:DUF1680-domain-containing protein n=1 Tax=Exidia glandulosa HHB12029 TaxID=1314781 RepID=A0A166AC12_EXIGL|nr:hypothetical protein EXIGLDRAFT_740764 [Exidia glandulosa HHB12029]